MPYTLWNIRDLGRHSGLQVERSFKFQAQAYPGYRHARTLGVIKGKDGKEGGGWKGEERESRSFVFVRRGDVIEGLQGPLVKRKRADSSESEDEASIEDETANWDEDEQEEKENGDEENWDGISDSDSDSDDQNKHEGNEDE
jgi:25S rRNA (uracil2634-N3)-methyltransferase